MKILAIRGRNLASLADTFEVNFRAEPLASAGLYAITGPTGSGKSTLLDALCLALYGATPRLIQASSSKLPDVKGETITSGDPRGILRRGAGEGYAEVDFVGGDGIDYRARWVARRARNRGAGKLQNVEMSLTRIVDEQDIGGNLVTDVKAAVLGKIGLKFEQFTRAVLLAQNEFAAFLKSNDNDRAELLEMLTGTDRFSDLSRRAYQRAKEESGKLQQLTVRLADQLPMAAEARAALETELVAALSGLEAAEQRRLRLEAQRRWHDAWEKAKAAELEAHAKLDSTTLSRDAGEERRLILQRVEAVQEARPLADECRRLAGESEAATTKVATAQQAFALATGGAQLAETALIAAKAAVAAAEQTRQSMTSELVQARALAAQIETLRPSHATLHTAQEGAEKALNTATQALQDKQTEIARAEAEQLEARTWLQEHAGTQVLAEQWPRWDTLLIQVQVVAADAAESGKVLAELAKTEIRQANDQAQGTARLAQQNQAASAAEAALSLAINAAAGFEATTLAKRRTDAEGLRDQLAIAADILSKIADQTQRQKELQRRSDSAQTALAENAARLLRATDAKPAAEQALIGAEHALRIADAASNETVETLRKGLEPRLPCPVCGAVDHPYTEHDPGLRAALKALKASVTTCRKTLDTLNQETATCGANAQNLERTRSELVQDLDGVLATLADATKRWEELPMAAEAPADHAVRGEWLEGRIAGTRTALTNLTAEEKAMHKALAAKDSAQAAATKAHRDQVAAREALTIVDQALQSTRQTKESEAAKQTEVTLRLAVLLDELDTAFPGPAAKGWRLAWQASPEDFHADRRQQAADWTTRRQRVDALAATLATLVAESKAFATARESATAQMGSAQQQFAQTDADLKGKQAQLRKLLGGRAPDEVESSLTAAIGAARQALSERQAAMDGAREALANATAGVNQSMETSLAVTVALQSATAMLDTWIADFNTAREGSSALDRASLEALLGYDAGWIGTERSDLQALDLAVGAAAAVLKECRRTRETHEQARQGEESAEALADQLTTTMAELEAAKQQHLALTLQKARDDERRARSAAIVEEIAAQEARVRIWAQINELIGSADGAKFRNIAQQMTLDVLLGYANRHLMTLAHRYRLERISDTLGLMVIDQDMGDEVRSVHSLSGGESFLVSLALALGLASLSSHRVKVESLFIDEGFGSLDADALRIAMEALDGLQAQGRKVGVISHVAEMTERIGIQIRVERQGGSRSHLSISTV